MKLFLAIIFAFLAISILEAKSFSEKLKQHNIHRRNVVKSQNNIWPGGIVPYIINGRNFTPRMHSILEESFQYFSNFTCIRFMPRTGGQKDYVVIRGNKEDGCSSAVGMKKGIQYLNLDPNGCFGSTATPIHEMLHTLGFYHQQSAANRDDHLTVIEQNIIESMKDNFVKISENETTDFGLPYDFDSIMQYPNSGFGKNFDKYNVEVEDGKGTPLWTSMAKFNPHREFGNAAVMSPLDHLKLKYRYQRECCKKNLYFPKRC